MPLTAAPSAALPSGMNTRRSPLCFASKSMGSTPVTRRTPPPSESSPKNAESESSVVICLLALSRAMRIGRS